MVVRIVLPGQAPDTSFGKSAFARIEGASEFLEAYVGFTQATVERMREADGPLTQSSDVVAAV